MWRKRLTLFLEGLIRLILEYGSSVRDPYTRLLARNWEYDLSMTGVLGQLKLEPLKKRKNRLILLYKGRKGKARIPTDDLFPRDEAVAGISTL